MVYLIGYDLRAPGRDYPDLESEIKSLGAWFHCMKSEWFVDSEESASSVYSRLREKTDSNDFILVNEMTQNYAGYLPKDAWPWLKKHLS